MKRRLESENDVKALVKAWYEKHGAWHYAPVQNGLGEHGIHDRVGGVPIEVTPEMVGRTVVLLVTVEAKRPGRRGEPDRGMSTHQARHLRRINEIGGIAICCDGEHDLAYLDEQFLNLQLGV